MARISQPMPPATPPPAPSRLLPSTAIQPLLDPPRPSVALARSVELTYRRFKIGQQLRKRPSCGLAAGDQHIIGSRQPEPRQYGRRGRAQPPLRPIAEDRVAHLAAGGETHSHSRIAVGLRRPPRRLQDEPRTDGAAANGSNTQKIGARLQPCKARSHVKSATRCPARSPR